MLKLRSSRKTRLGLGALAVAAVLALPAAGDAAFWKGVRWHGRINDARTTNVTVVCAPGALRGFAKAGQTLSVVRGGPARVTQPGTFIDVKLYGKNFRFTGFGTKGLVHNRLPCSGKRRVDFVGTDGSKSSVYVTWVGVAS